MFWKKLSIGSKLFVTLVATVALTLALFATAIFWNMRDGFSDYILSAEVQRFGPLADALADAHDPTIPGWPQFVDNRMAFDNFVKGVLPPIPRSVLKTVGEDGLARRDPLGLRTRLGLHGPDDLHIAGAKMNGRSRGRFPIVNKEKEDNETLLGYIVLAKPAQDPRSLDLIFEKEQIWMLSIAAMVATIFSSFATYFLTRQFTSPINQLLRATQKLSSGDLHTRLNTDRFDELGELQAQFNNLAETLESNERAERQWISDTSHELRTPLAILRAEIEALQDGVRKSDVKTLSTLHDSVIRLSTLVQDISVLAHAREGVIAGVLNTENLSEIVRDCANAAEALLRENGLELEMSIEPNLLVDCDSLRIGQLIDNLISNSNRYTDAGGRVQIKMFRQRRRVFIHFEDTGPCPSGESIPKLFDRFYRDEKSRSRASGGSGLGLPICRAIVVAHGGYIYAERSTLGGLKVVIALPMQQPGRTA